MCESLNCMLQIYKAFNLPVHGDLHLQRPSAASQETVLLKLQSHCCVQLCPNRPKAHLVAQASPIHPGLQVHCPLCGLHEPSLRQLQRSLQSFPQVPASHGRSHRCPFQPMVQKHCPVSGLHDAPFSHPHFCEQSWPNVPSGHLSSHFSPW